MKEKLDKPLYGFLAGAITPIVSFIPVWLIIWGNRPLSSFWNFFLHTPNPENQIKIMTLCLIGNMFLFWLVFFQVRMNRFSMGLVLSSVLYLIVIVAKGV